MRLENIAKSVCKYYSLELLDLKSKIRKANICRAKKLFCVIAKRNTPFSEAEIGSFLESSRHLVNHYVNSYSDENHYKDILSMLKTIDTNFKTIVFLDGGKSIDARYHLEELITAGKYYITVTNDLYEHPEKLELLPILKPDCIHVQSTNTRHEYMDILAKKFKSLNWIPKNIIFWSEESYLAYSDIVDDLKKNHGTRLWSLDRYGELKQFRYYYDDKIDESIPNELQ